MRSHHRRSQQSRSARRRHAVALIVVFAIVAVFGVRLFDFQVVRAAELNKASASKQTAETTVWGTRGSIVDANGVVLADSVERWDITASPKDVVVDGFTRSKKAKDGTVTKEHVSVMEALGEIAEITGSDTNELYDALSKDPTSNFAYLVKGVKLDVFNKVKALNIPWVWDKPHPARTYPNGAVAGNLVGFLGTDGPLAGLERSYDSCLQGTDGSQTYEVSRDGVRMPGSTITTKQAVDGGTLKLTIDSDLQYFAQQTIAAQAQAMGAQWATAAVVDTRTGKLLVAADYPSIDPNDLNSVPAESSGSRFFTAPYEPGSIMKPATVASLIDAGVLQITDKYTVPGWYTNGLPAGSKIGDVFAHGDMHWTVAGIIEQSSNVGVSMISEKLPLAQRTAYLKKFGFGTKTGVGFLGEESGTVQNPVGLDAISNKAQQFGQAISVTSAQMASLYQTLGNNGVTVPLSLVEGCQHPDATVTDVPSTTPTRVVSDYAAQQTLLAMETVASKGPLSKTIGIPGYRVAAKSGTAQVGGADGKYGSDRIVSVAGILKVDDPNYAVIVTLGLPTKIKTSAAAAPAFAAIMKQVIKTYRVQPSTTATPDTPTEW
ncbi:peptidoglycan D,D-transpeptidase FtsI family protein [Schumannella soli]|uniref:Penicillin-binding protein 2 n=1 Tax=Schumannella soli TaxID=2590779 RepID=A0A506Y5U2_9MICO|nr:penicillin-binding protein 2 [Schumannella soli]TPW76388.1 penicillin-binding protein 2 [Schumannella soli]